jgi:hypothetical protein
MAGASQYIPMMSDNERIPHTVRRFDQLHACFKTGQAGEVMWVVTREELLATCERLDRVLAENEKLKNRIDVSGLKEAIAGLTERVAALESER